MEIDISPRDAFFLDLDGTLIETAPTPDDVRASRRVADLLRRLSTATSGATMIVSGRALSSIDALLGGRFPAAGQYGAEIRFANPALEEIHLEVPDFEGLRARCAAIATRHPGCLLEVKAPALALHMDARDIRFPKLAAELDALARAWHGAVVTIRALNVVELRPTHVDKGRVLEGAALFRPFAGRRPVFVGNDLPDIDGFRAAVAAGGIGIAVGRPLPWARHTLEGPGAVLDALERVAAGR